MNVRTVLALAGRRVDGPGAAVRFPESRVEIVRGRVEAKFREVNADWLVSSGACGADLIGLEVAARLNIRRRIVLPFAAERFRATSVVDRPGDWGPMFDVAVAAARQSGDLVELDLGESDSAYLRANEEILDQAHTLAAGGPIVAVLTWEGHAREGGDITAAFATLARQRRIRVEEVLTT